MPLRIDHIRGVALIRRVVLALLFALIAFLSVSVILNIKKRNTAFESSSRPATEKEVYQEKVRALDFAGEKKRFSIKAGRIYIDEAGRQRFEGGVEMVVLEPGGLLRITAATAVIASGNELLQAEDNVQIETEDYSMMARRLEFDLKRRTARAEKVEFESESLQLSSGAMFLQTEEKRLEFQEEISGKIRDLSGQVYFLEADRLAVNITERSFLAENLRLNSKWIRLDGKRAEGLQAEKGELERLNLTAGAGVRWKILADESELQEVELHAGGLGVENFREKFFLSASGKFRVRGAGQELKIQGSGENLGLSAEKRAPRLLQAENCELTFEDKNGETYRVGGRKVLYDLPGNLLEVETWAELNQENYRLEAGGLVFDIKGQILRAKNFSLELEPAFFERKSPLFTCGAGVMINGAILEGRPGFFQMSGQVRISGERQFFQAESVRLETNGQFLIERVFPGNWKLEKAGGRKQTLEIAAGQITSSQVEPLLLLENGARLKTDSFRLESREMILLFQDDSSLQVQSVEARGGVNFNWKDYKVFGERAVYDFEYEKIELTGNPRLVTPSGDWLETDKLTLFLADDRIRLESQKRERSLTILVRGR
ncbi:MAG: hypothetical protein QME28_04865 [Candidatus Saccharicenans sp.]|nr:hypothetical protein [Candidatus Saccharicenans sp.]